MQSLAKAKTNANATLSLLQRVKYKTQHVIGNLYKERAARHFELFLLLYTNLHMLQCIFNSSM